ncbi:MAG: serine hydrolase [Bacteroidia bacterium]|nr:serine hydrolase [Bacteroidia bacterium]
MSKTLVPLIFLIFTNSGQWKAQALYFPPINGSETWDTLSPAALGWCTNKIDSLYNYLQQENTKGFMVLKDGKIVLEKYFGTFTKDSAWYWASAGKTLTSFLIGQAQEEGFLKITDTTSDYLLPGWTNCTPAKEEKITIWHQLTMTSGLDDAVPDNHCTLDTCLDYKADAGTRWAYHNAPYTLLEKVIVNATSIPINTFTQTRLKNKTGMSGTWLTIGYDNIYYSRLRSMARFALLAQNNGVWNSDTLLADAVYLNQMVNTSQNINLSYGYLWWLNGKASYMVPGLQIQVPGSYAPDAPSDMVAGIGKNGQIMSIAKSKGLVLLRMGNAPSTNSEVPYLICNEMWKRLNAIMCVGTGLNETSEEYPYVNVFPNPVSDVLHINVNGAISGPIQIIDSFGQVIIQSEQTPIRVSELPAGLYFLSFRQNARLCTAKFIRE